MRFFPTRLSEQVREPGKPGGDGHLAPGGAVRAQRQDLPGHQPQVEGADVEERGRGEVHSEGGHNGGGGGEGRGGRRRRRQDRGKVSYWQQDRGYDSIPILQPIFPLAAK